MAWASGGPLPRPLFRIVLMFHPLLVVQPRSSLKSISADIKLLSKDTTGESMANSIGSSISLMTSYSGKNRLLILEQMIIKHLSLVA